MSGLGSRAGIRPPWRFGQKAVYLPSFTIKLLRTPKLDPYQARFMVPLNFSKFDLRDYLWNLYGVRALSVRSWVQLQPIRRSKHEGASHRGPWYRPQSKKFMVIEMDKPFRWPEPPEDMEERYERDSQRAMALEQRESLRRSGRDPDNSPYESPGNRRSLQEQAEALLAGKEKWRPTWQEIAGR